MPHISISPPIKAWVKKHVLYNMDTQFSNYNELCEIIGVSSYKNNSPTFIINVNGAIFYYVPPNLIFNKADYKETTSLKNTCYNNCPSEKFFLYKLDSLLNKKIYSYFKHIGKWRSGKYLFSLDWPDDNIVLNCLSLDNGWFSFTPNHKMLISDKEPKNLPNYKKLKREWIVPKP